MSLESHLAELVRKHGELERQLDQAMAQPATDQLVLVELKRKKLKLKDEIERMKGATRH